MSPQHCIDLSKQTQQIFSAKPPCKLPKQHVLFQKQDNYSAYIEFLKRMLPKQVYRMVEPVKSFCWKHALQKIIVMCWKVIRFQLAVWVVVLPVLWGWDIYSYNNTALPETRYRLLQTGLDLAAVKAAREFESVVLDHHLSFEDFKKPWYVFLETIKT